VSDTGVGIPADSLEKIFEAFSQLSGQDAKSYAGTGLGLTITRNLVEMMGGRISVQSKVHQGSTFEILLPCVAVASSLDKPLAREFLDTENLRFHEAAVLVVDDNELNRQLVGEILRSSGLKAFEAEDGEKGVAAALRHQPDVILMDIRMPVMDGYEALNRLRNSSQTRHIPVIALTASAMKEEKRKILKSQFDGYVVKPVEKQLLFRALARFLPYSILSDTETAGDRPPVFHKPIPPGVLKNIPGVIENLEAFMAEWAAVRQKQYIPDIQHFGEEIKKLGDQHEIKEVSEYGDHLLFHISSYDIEKIFTALEMYPNLIETLKEINQGEHLS
jgi:CheY-like chemotaxis protein